MKIAASIAAWRKLPRFVTMMPSSPTEGQQLQKRLCEEVASHALARNVCLHSIHCDSPHEQCSFKTHGQKNLNAIDQRYGITDGIV